MKAAEARKIIKQLGWMTDENTEEFWPIFEAIEDWDEDTILDFFAAIPPDEGNDYCAFAFSLLEQGKEVLNGRIPPRLENMQGYWCEILKWAVTENR